MNTRVLSFFQERLKSQEGLTAKVFHLHFKEQYEDSTFRKAIGKLKKLLAQKGFSLVEKGRPKVYFLEDDVNIVELWLNDSKKSLSPKLIDFLRNTIFELPGNLISDLQNDSYDLKNVSGVYKVAFEKIYGYHDFETFLEIFESINRKPLDITYLKYADNDFNERIIFYPEYLKLYKSSWYAFGVAKTQDDVFYIDNNGTRTNAFVNPFYVDIKLIDKIRNLKCKTKFIKSKIDYNSFFDGIIGVDNINRSVEEVLLLVRNGFVNRMRHNPIHSTFKIREDLPSDVEGFTMASINVKRNKELIRTLISYGSDVVVLEPLALKNDIVDELNKSLSLYNC